MEPLHTEKRNGYTLTVEYEQFADDPTNWGNFTIVQFRDRDFTNYADIDEYLTESGKLLPEWRAKLRSGKAFAFTYNRYSNADGGFYRYPTNEVPTGEIDSRDLNGLIVFEDEYVKGISFDERKKYAEQDLATYTQYANGEVYNASIIEDATGEYIDGSGDCYGLDETIQQGKDTLDRLDPTHSEVVAVFDNGGKTLDRYTFVTKQVNKYNGFYTMLGTSETGEGFSQFSEGQYTPDGDNSHLGKQVRWSELSEELQKHAASRLDQE